MSLANAAAGNPALTKSIMHMSTLRCSNDNSNPVGRVGISGDAASRGSDLLQSRGTFSPRRAVSLVALALAGTFLHAEAALAKNVVVLNGSIPGTTTCKPNIGAANTFTTIKAAMNALPLAAFTAENTIFICPGTYPEQIVIDRNVAIVGVVDGVGGSNSSEIRIVPPTVPFVNVTFPRSGVVQAQVVAVGLADVSITNLTLDGNNQCPAGVDRTAGVAFLNVGVKGTNMRGLVSKSSVKNHIATTDGFTHCGSYLGEGILLENSIVTLDSNVIRGVDWGAIHQFGGISKINKNNVGQGYIGIWLQDVSDTDTTIGSSVTANNVSNFASGIYLDGSSNVGASNNIIGTWTGDAFAITRGAADNQITGNNIFDANHGVYLNGGGAFGPPPTRNAFKNNTILRSVYQAIAIAYSEGGNTFTGNTINDAPFGVFIAYVDPVPPNDVVAPNTLNNVRNLNGFGAYVP
jgi:hypothetical protein